jgi:hypothetical protein
MLWLNHISQVIFDDPNYRQSYSGCISSAVTGTPQANYYTVLYMASAGNVDHGTQFISCMNYLALYFRQGLGNNKWSAWQKITFTSV